MTGTRPDPYADLREIQDRTDPYADLRSLSSIVPEEDEEQKAQRIEAEQKRKRDEVLQNFERGSVLRALADQALSLGQDFRQAGSDPASVLRGMGRGVESFLEFGKGLVTDPVNAIPSAAHGLIYNGIIRPFIQTPLQLLGSGLGIDTGWQDLSPEERELRIKESSANFIGAAVAGAFSKFANSKELMKVTGSKNVTELLNNVQSLGDDKLLQLANYTTDPALRKSALQGVKKLAQWGIPTGLLTGDTPEERFSNAVNYGIVSGVLGSIGGGIRYVRGLKEVTTADQIRTVARAESARRMTDALVADLPPIEQAMTASKIAKAVFDDPEEVIPAIVASASDKSVVVKDLPIKLPRETTLTLTREVDPVVRSPNPADVSTTFGGTNNLVAFAQQFDQTQPHTVNGFLDDLKAQGIDPGYAVVQYLTNVVGMAADEAATFVNTHYKQHYSDQLAPRTETRTTKVYFSKKAGNALVMPDRELTPKQLDQFEAHGFFESAFVDYGGKKYQVDGFNKRGKATLIDEYGRIVKDVSTDKIALLDIQDSPTPKLDKTTFWDIIREDKASQDKIDTYLKMADEARQTTVEGTTSAAASRGFLIRQKNGQFEVFDPVEGTSRGLFPTLDELSAYIRNIASPFGRGVILDNGELSGASFVAPTDLPKAQQVGLGRLEGMASRFALRFPQLTTAPQYFKSINNLYPDAQIWSAYLRLNQARNAAIAAKNPLYARLDVAASKFYAAFEKLDPDAREQVLGDITHGLETVKYSEAIGSDRKKWYLKNRPVNPNERRVIEDVFGQADSADSFGKVVSLYSTGYDDAIREGVPDLRAHVVQMATEAGLTNKEIELVGRLHDVHQQALKTPLDQFSLAQVIALTHAKLADTPSLDEFISAKKWDRKGVEVSTIQALKEYYEQAADIFGVDPKSRLNYYHPRIYERDKYKSAGEEPAPLNRRLLAEDKDFQHALHRLGIRSDYIQDPILASLIYTNRGVRRTFETGALQEFQAAVDQTAAKMTYVDKSGETRFAGGNFKQAVETFLDDFQHYLPKEDAAGQAGLQAYLKALGVEDSQLKGFARTLLNLSSTATMGYAPIQAIRDAITTGQVYVTALGPKAFRRLLENYGKHTEAIYEALRKSGIVPNELHRFLFDDKVKHLNTAPGLADDLVGKIGQAYEKFGEIGFKMSGQAYVYRNMHIAATLERYQTFNEALTKFMDHKNIEKFKSDIGLNVYSRATQNNVLTLVNAKEFSAAARNLAMATGAEFVGWYGNATHPIGWGTKWGRVLGQFGQWPLWGTQMMAQLASRGSNGVYARWGLATAALVGAGMASGINFSQWTLSPFNSSYFGGPWAGMGLAMGSALAHPDPAVQQFYQRYVMNRLNPLRNPKQVYLGIPFQFWNMLSAVGIYEPNENVESMYNMTPHLRGARLLGFSINPWKEWGIDITQP